MKPIIRIFLILMAVALPVGVYAADALKKVEPQYVCMINNKLFDKPQLPITVAGQTYYGCCAMCKEKLEKSAQARTATDPVSGKMIDKAAAVIGAQADGVVHYFENEENLQKFNGALHDHGEEKH